MSRKKNKQIKGTDHSPQVNRLRRIEGQVRGLISMVEEQRYCIDIVTQVKAVKAALTTFERSIVDEHLKHCVHDAISSKDSKRASAAMEEIAALLKSSMK